MGEWSRTCSPAALQSFLVLLTLQWMDHYHHNQQYQQNNKFAVEQPVGPRRHAVPSPPATPVTPPDSFAQLHLPIPPRFQAHLMYLHLLLHYHRSVLDLPNLVERIYARYSIQIAAHPSLSACLFWLLRQSGEGGKRLSGRENAAGQSKSCLDGAARDVVVWFLVGLPALTGRVLASTAAYQLWTVEYAEWLMVR